VRCPRPSATLLSIAWSTSTTNLLVIGLFAWSA
jgi:hypothetical protein